MWAESDEGKINQFVNYISDVYTDFIVVLVANRERNVTFELCLYRNYCLQIDIKQYLLSRIVEIIE